MTNFLTAQQVLILHEAHHSARFRKSVDRIKTILALNQGLTYKECAKLLLLDEITIRRYEKKFQKRGIDGLLESRYHGSIRNLTKQQKNLRIEYTLSTQVIPTTTTDPFMDGFTKGKRKQSRQIAGEKGSI
jgi:Winged helix-turn helix